MRSTYFEKNFEYQIRTEGEFWNQGEVICGDFEIKNLSKNVLSMKSLKLTLAYGLKKAIKEKSEFSWEIFENLLVAENISILSNNSECFKWTINLKTDCPISDTFGGLFLLFGGENYLSRGGLIDLNVNLHPFLKSFLQTFSTQFSFLEKYQKRKKEWTEVKLLPPESKEFTKLDSVICLLRILNEKIEIHYSFKMKGLGRSGEQMKIIKKKLDFSQTMNKEKYLISGEFPNRAFFKESIDKALSIARPEVVF